MLISTNVRGNIIGQDHWNAKLSDIEVDALIRDRGPDDAPLMSYSQLAAKYGISKSSVRDILIGRRRGQPQRLVDRQPSSAPKDVKRVRVNLRVNIRARSILHRLGGGNWIDMIAAMVDAECRCARGVDEKQALERVMKKFGVTDSRAPGVNTTRTRAQKTKDL